MHIERIIFRHQQNGFVQYVAKGVKIHMYEFGKYNASSELYEAGASITDLQSFHGHSLPQTRLLYTKIDKRFTKIEDLMKHKFDKRRNTSEGSPATRGIDR